MKILKKAILVTLATIILILPAAARAEDTMQRTLRDSIYGGVIGALAGTAVLLLTKNPGDHLGFIPTGAGVGILVGAAYGVASSGVVEAAAEVENGKVAFKAPTINRVEVYDKNANNLEVINIVQLLRFNW
ncbi:MAG: hypothetical protein HZB22_07790 [Deltaproteobacteria bacterium]|nr:hypothetical protein [Deltaproteobacteria bacterium]